MTEIKLPEKIEMILEKEIHFLPNRVMQHSEEQIEKLANSIEIFKFDNPLILGLENNIYYVIAGEAVLKAARSLRIEKVPCVILEHLTMAQMRAYAIADNNIAKNSGWDESLLSIELGHLDSLGFDLESIGFDFSDADFLAIEEMPTPTPVSDTPPIPEPIPKSTANDVDSVSTVKPVTPVSTVEPIKEPEKVNQEPINTEPVIVKEAPIAVPNENKEVPIAVPNENKEAPIAVKTQTKEESITNENKEKLHEIKDHESPLQGQGQGQGQEEEKEEEENYIEEKESVACPRCNHSWSQ